MRTIAHISDLHFGRHDPALIARLVSTLAAIRPGIVVISGDLTQRAKEDEFAQAKQFVAQIERMGMKTFVIPGNHDIEPHHRPLVRLSDPLRPYRTHFSETTEPLYRDDEVAIAGIDTTQRTSFAEGRAYPKKIERAARFLESMPDGTFRIAVMHHPIALPLVHKLLPKYQKHHRLARDSRKAVLALTESGVDLMLSGHNHRTTVARTGERHDVPHREAIALQAGTLSVRIHGQEPSFNMLTIDGGMLTVDVYEWVRADARFEIAKSHEFERGESGWREK